MKLNSFKHFFPAPDFLALPAVALDISDRSVKFLKIGRSKYGFSIKTFGEKIIPEGTIESGVIQNKEGLTSLLRDLVKEEGFDKAVVSLPEEKAFLVTMHLEGVNKKELRESISLQIEEHIPLPGAEIIFDYDILREYPGGYEVAVTAMSKGIVTAYFNVVSEAGILPVAMEVEGQAMARSLVKKNNESTYMIVDFGRMRTSFTIISDGKARFSTTVPIGGEKIVTAIENNLKVGRDKARNMKEEIGLKKDRDENLFQAITPVVSVLRDEISKHHSYWNNRVDEKGHPYPDMYKVIVCGGDANIPGLMDYLASGCDLTFDIGNPWLNMSSIDKYVPEINRNHALRYATAIGLALRNI